MVEIIALNRIATGGIVPDLTVLIDIPVAEGLARKRYINFDRFEKEEKAFHERVRKGYLALAKAEPERFIIIDGRQDRKTVAAAVWDRVSRRLG
jgi:dTMP kinase